MIEGSEYTSEPEEEHVGSESAGAPLFAVPTLSREADTAPSDEPETARRTRSRRARAVGDTDATAHDAEGEGDGDLGSPEFTSVAEVPARSVVEDRTDDPTISSSRYPIVCEDDLGEDFGAGYANGSEKDLARWAEEADSALVRAKSLETPESWEEVARIATVVSFVTQTTRSIAEAREKARHAVQAADSAREAAKTAAQAALVLMQEARDAVHVADEMEKAVALARTADTADAWREASQLVACVTVDSLRSPEPGEPLFQDK